MLLIGGLFLEVRIMNYIKRLEDENKVLKNKMTEVKAKIMELENYLNGPKFHCGDSLDNYVNTQDVIDRIKDIKTDLIL
jgi:predicted RNase H-like nuclease (RuvC/YqgF family)